MRYAVTAFALFVGLSAFASDPGQPLDCSDWVAVQPGITCYETPFECNNDLPCVGAGYEAVDNTHHVVFVRTSTLPTGCGNYSMGRTSVVQMDLVSGASSTIGYFDDRCENGCIDRIGPGPGTAFARLLLDNTNGSVVVYLESLVGDNGSTNCQSRADKYRPVVFSGFTSMFDVLQSFSPPTALSFRVPYMPEGLGGADHFDTYWGSLTKPIDFTQAHPLQCGYPATAPHVGEYETVSDTLPTPSPDSGYYYITATTYQGQTRYGRKTSNGQLSGRDPALLPACVNP